MPRHDRQDRSYAAYLSELCNAVDREQWEQVKEKVSSQRMSLEMALLLTLAQSCGYTLFAAKRND